MDSDRVLEEETATKREQRLKDLRHALKNHLVIIIGYAQLLQEDKGSDQHSKDCVSKILTAAWQAAELVSRLNQDPACAERIGSSVAPAATNIPMVRSHKILIVEDDEAVRVFLYKVLSKQHQVEMALHGEEALEKFASSRFDAVLIDLGLPGMTGDRVAKEIRRLDPEVATILVSGSELKEDDPKLSAFDFRIQKPFQDMQEVKNVVAQAIELSVILQRNFDNE